MKKPLRWALLSILCAAGGASIAYAFSVTGEYDHGSTIQYELRCDSGNSARVTYYKSSGEYCTSLGSCANNLSRAARWACGE